MPWRKKKENGISGYPCYENKRIKDGKAKLKAFFSGGGALPMAVVLSVILVLVGVLPLFIEAELDYTDNNLANIPPSFSQMHLSDDLAYGIRDINGISGVSIGVDRNGRVYLFGATSGGVGDRIFSLPDALEGGAVAASCGYDHAIAVTADGRVVGWGADELGQYGKSNAALSTSIAFMPDELSSGLDTELLTALECGYQTTAMVYDGRLYAWGNRRNMLNMDTLLSGSEAYRSGETRAVDVAVGNYYAAVLYDDGSIYAPTVMSDRTTVYSSLYGRRKLLDIDSPIVCIAASKDSFAFATEEGEICVVGPNENGEGNIPHIPEGEKVLRIEGGSAHFVCLTDKGHAYAWGRDSGGQCEVNGVSCENIYTGAEQTYLADSEGRLIHKSGVRWYPFGTDGLGRDVFTRVIHGGRTTLTVGVVAVIVATVIAVIVGAVSGYFGGWVDTALMRLTEIFSSMPFLPFAMLLSYAVRKNPIDESVRIFIIMVILGLLSWPSLARLVRAEVLRERERDFVLAARATGVGRWRIAFRHILPNTVSVVLVSVTLDLAGCLLIESSLSYLGFGVQQPRPTWGNMLNGANNSTVIQSYWWQWVFPALLLALTTLSINVIGDRMRDMLDPKNKES